MDITAEKQHLERLYEEMLYAANRVVEVRSETKSLELAGASHVPDSVEDKMTLRRLAELDALDSFWTTRMYTYSNRHADLLREMRGGS